MGEGAGREEEGRREGGSLAAFSPEISTERFSRRALSHQAT